MASPRTPSGFEELAALLRDLMQQNPQWKRRMLIAVPVVAAAGLAFYLAGQYLLPDQRTLVTVISAIGGVFWALCTLALFEALLPPRKLTFGGVELTIDQDLTTRHIRTEGKPLKTLTAREHAGATEERPAGRRFGEIASVDLSLKELVGYYTINKDQARSSYRFGVFLICAGLLILVAGIGLLYYGHSPNVTTTALTGVASILVQLIGAYQLYVARGTQQQTRYFYAQLTELQQTLLALDLCERIDDKAERNRARLQVALTLLTRSLPASNESTAPAKGMGTQRNTSRG